MRSRSHNLVIESFCSSYMGQLRTANRHLTKVLTALLHQLAVYLLLVPAVISFVTEYSLQYLFQWSHYIEARNRHLDWQC